MASYLQHITIKSLSLSSSNPSPCFVTLVGLGWSSRGALSRLSHCSFDVPLCLPMHPCLNFHILCSSSSCIAFYVSLWPTFQVVLVFTSLCAHRVWGLCLKTFLSSIMFFNIKYMHLQRTFHWQTFSCIHNLQSMPPTISHIDHHILSSHTTIL